MIKSKIKNIINKILFPNTYSSQAYTNYLRNNGVKIGERTIFYGPKTTTIDVAGGSGNFIEIGDCVQITQGVIVLAHDYSYSVLGNVYYDLPRNQRRTYIGNNVFIGMNSIILMGTQIGDNTIIGAGSVASGKLEPNSVYAGNPARKIRSLEEHYRICKEHFEDSARCFIENRYDCDYKDIEMDSLGIYQVLFQEKEAISQYLQNANFQGVSGESIKKINMDYKKYKDIKDLFKGE